MKQQTRNNTPRIKLLDNLQDYIGVEFSTNLSPTMRAKLTRFNKDKGFFIVTDNPLCPHYSSCAGQKFSLPIKVVYSLNQVV